MIFFAKTMKSISERILYMNFILCTSFFIFSAIVFFGLQRTKRLEKKIEQEYWDKEYRANSTRKKSLDNLDYITIPDEILQMTPETMDEDVNSYLLDLHEMSEYKIVNLTGISNTDLKLKYGTANITVLSDYDFHYTNMVTTLQRLAEKLYENEEYLLAKTVLEFAVSTRTDISKSYYMLADIYNILGYKEKVAELINRAQLVNSIMRQNIVENLQTYASAN